VICSNNTMTFNSGTNTAGQTTLNLTLQFSGNGSITINHSGTGGININTTSGMIMNAATSTVTLNALNGPINMAAGAAAATYQLFRLNLNAATTINGSTGTYNVAQLQAVATSGSIAFSSSSRPASLSWARA
jgi:hypothetical protein